MMTRAAIGHRRRANLAAIHAALDRLPQHFHAGTVDLLVITIGECRKSRRLCDQHPHHLAPAAVFDDVLVDKAELRAQQIGRRTLVTFEQLLHGIERHLHELPHHRNE
jgi:hypothetical protein